MILKTILKTTKLFIKNKTQLINYELLLNVACSLLRNKNSNFQIEFYLLLIKNIYINMRPLQVNNVQRDKNQEFA